MSETPSQAATRRALRILAVLPSHTLTGVSNKALAASLGTSPSNVSRALAALEEEGFAQRLANGLWGPSVKLLALCMAYSMAVETQQQRALEIQQQTLSRAQHYLA